VRKRQSACDNDGSEERRQVPTHVEQPFERVNPNPFFSPLSSSDIRAHRLNDEVLLLVPRPSSVDGYSSISVVTVAGKRLHVYVLSKWSTVTLDPRDAVKVLHGKCRYLFNAHALQQLESRADHHEGLG
jgi:hypothetical protein